MRQVTVRRRGVGSLATVLPVLAAAPFLFEVSLRQSMLKATQRGHFFFNQEFLPPLSDSVQIGIRLQVEIQL